MKQVDENKVSSNTPVILMIEDSPDIVDINRFMLEQHGYTSITAETLAQAREVIRQRKDIDMVLLDITLPDGNGLEFIPELQKVLTVPILILTSKTKYDDIVQGLTSGADDYLTKPYYNEELMARIAALLQKKQKPLQKRIKFTRGSLTFDTDSMRVFLDEQNLMLQPREYTVLAYLAYREGEIIPGKRLYEEVWKMPYTDSSSISIRATISRMRKKLKNSGCSIEATRGQGYLFIRG